MHWMNGMGIGGFGMILWWGLIILGTIALGKWIFDRRSPVPQQESPLEILKRRYAKGEIAKEEFQELKKDLI